MSCGGLGAWLCTRRRMHGGTARVPVCSPPPPPNRELDLPRLLSIKEQEELASVYIVVNAPLPPSVARLRCFVLTQHHNTHNIRSWRSWPHTPSGRRRSGAECARRLGCFTRRRCRRYVCTCVSRYWFHGLCTVGGVSVFAFYLLGMRETWLCVCLLHEAALQEVRTIAFHFGGGFSLTKRRRPQPPPDQRVALCRFGMIDTGLIQPRRPHPSHPHRCACAFARGTCSGGGDEILTYSTLIPTLTTQPFA